MSCRTGEAAEQAAERDLKEETGLAMTLHSMTDLGGLAPEAGVIQARSRLFVAHVDAQRVEVVTPEFGHGELCFFDRVDILEKIEQGDIEDASTLMLVYKWLM